MGGRVVRRASAASIVLAAVIVAVGARPVGAHSVCSPYWHLDPEPALHATVEDLSATADGTVWAVGDNGLLARFDGRHWRREWPAGLTGDDDLRSVDMVDPSHGWAVGLSTRDGGRILRWDGRRWRFEHVPGLKDDSLWNVDANGASDVWAVGDYVSGSLPVRWVAYHWNGRTWRRMFLTTPATTETPTDGGVMISSPYLDGVAVVAPDDVWAGGMASTANGRTAAVAEHWDGTSWSTVPTPVNADADQAMGALSVIDERDIWAAKGEQGGANVLHWNGRTWSDIPLPASVDQTRDIAAVTPTDVWVSGHDRSTHSTLMHWNGKAWRAAAPSRATRFDDGYFTALTALGSNDIWAAGYAEWGKPLFDHYACS
jgi:hypothetical protein